MAVRTVSSSRTLAGLQRKYLNFNGVDNYVDLGMGQTDLEAVFGDITGINPVSGGSEPNYMVCACWVYIPSDVNNDETVVDFGNTASTFGPEWWVRVYSNTNKQLRLYIDDNVSSWNMTTGNNAFNFGWNHIAIVQRRRPSFAAGWIRHEFYLNGVIHTTTDNYMGGRTFSPWSHGTIAARRRTTDTNFGEIKVTDLLLYDLNKSSDDVFDMYSGSPPQGNLILQYNMDNNVINQVNPGTFDGTLSSSAPTYGSEYIIPERTVAGSRTIAGTRTLV